MDHHAMAGNRNLSREPAAAVCQRCNNGAGLGQPSGKVPGHVIDVELPDHDMAKELAEMESRAQFAVGEDHDATQVLMYLARRLRPDHDPHTTPATTVLSIRVWSLAHPAALTGGMELDKAGTPLWIGMPDALPRVGNRRTC